MNYKRRDFIRLGGNLAAVMALAPLASKLLPAEEERKKLKTFGLQLYSLRDDLPKDPRGVLKQVAEAGYKQIESFEHKDLGMFWGMSNTDFKKYMDDLGMTILSSHCDSNKDFEKKVAQAAAIDMKYLIYPWEGPGKTVDDYKKFADELNAKGEICKKNGIKFGFHNHDFSFYKINGQYPEEVLLDHADPALVDFEVDLYWVVTAGADPIEWLKKYRNRFKLCHVKDRMKYSKENAATCTLGEGMIDYPNILKVAKDNGVKYFLVEQERYDGSTPLKAMAADAQYMKEIRI